METDSILIELFGSTPQLKVLDFLLDNNIFDYTKTDIANGAGITRPTLYKIWDKFEKFCLVTKTRKINRTQLYKVNPDSPLIKKIIEIEMKFSVQGVKVGQDAKVKPIAIKV